MTERYLMKWYKENLLAPVEKAIAFKKEKNPQLIYTPDWLIAIAYRETWTKAIEYAGKGITFKNIAEIIKGDYSQRTGEKVKQWHGFGFWQIDTGSFPDFVKTGDWKDPYKCCCKAIDVLEGKRMALLKGSPNFSASVAAESFHRAITSAYNCGEGNVLAVIKEGKDIDSRTHEKNYSKKVWEYRKLYNSL